MKMEQKENPKCENSLQQSQTGGAKPPKLIKPKKGIDLIGEDLLQIILSKLPALSFASAALVSRSWNIVCNRLLSRPKLSSALSLNPSLQIAVKEVLDKVLSEPIRPHFAIAYVSPKYSLQATHKLITGVLGARTPVITSESFGIIGRDVIANKFKEVQWDITDDEDSDSQVDNSSTLVTTGIVLTVGFVPGLKVDAVPLLRPVKEHHVAMVDEFVMEIRLLSEKISGFGSPAGIIMFGGHGTDMTPVLDKMDYAMSMATFIVGGENGLFLYRSKGDSRKPGHISAAVALLFARDRNKPHGIGETEFHITLSTGVSPIGLTHKAVSVREKRDSGYSTWLTARREGRREILDGQTCLNYISDELGDHVEDHALYVGVIKRRKFTIELENARWITSMAFHEVLGGDQEYLFVNGVGIRTGDSFRFYKSDSNSALSFCSKVSENFRNLKQDNDPKNSHSNGDRKEVFGGIMFSCCGRGESFFGRPNVDSSLFLENFPGIPLAGAFCGGEIRRGSLSSCSQEPQESAVQSSRHVFSTVYLVMSYTPPRQNIRSAYGFSFTIDKT